jgi:hypothetical protein
MSRSQFLEGVRTAGAKGLLRVPSLNPLSQDSSVNCIACGGDLNFLPYAYPLTFGCSQGHFVTLQALLDVFLPQEQLPEMSALECWERKALLLRQLAQRALEVGHVFTAADFQEVADRIEHWVSTLRTMLTKTEDEALLSS